MKKESHKQTDLLNYFLASFIPKLNSRLQIPNGIKPIGVDLQIGAKENYERDNDLMGILFVFNLFIYIEDSGEKIFVSNINLKLITVSSGLFLYQKLVTAKF